MVRAVRRRSGYYLPQIAAGLRAEARLMADVAGFGRDVLAGVEAGVPVTLTAAKVETALLRSGDDLAWRRWRTQHRSGDSWQPGGEGELWVYDPRTGTLDRHDDN